jgi:hypothetical protein
MAIKRTSLRQFRQIPTVADLLWVARHVADLLLVARQDVRFK